MRLLNLLTKGKDGKQDYKSVETFTSTIRNLDKQVDLDKRIKHGNIKYHGELSTMAAKLAYENVIVVNNIVQNHWEMEFMEGFFDFYYKYKKRDTIQVRLFSTSILSSYSFNIGQNFSSKKRMVRMVFYI